MRENRILLIIILCISVATGYFLYDSYLEINLAYSNSKKALIVQRDKRQQITKMHHASRERSFILLRMLDEDDFFELDKLNQRLSEYAQLYIKARIEFNELSLSKKEKRLMAVQLVAAWKNAPLQNQVAKLLMSGKHEQAKKLLLEKALPGQNKVFETPYLYPRRRKLDDRSKNSGPK